MAYYITNGLTYMARQPDDSYSAVVTGPPSNNGIDYRGISDSLSPDAYSAFSRAWIRQALRVAPVAVINFAAKTSDAAALSRFMADLDACGSIQSHIVWVKSLHVNGQTHGHFKPVNSPRYLTNTHESILVVSRDGTAPLDRLAVGVPFEDKTNITRFAGNDADVRCRGNVWFVPYQTKREKDAHPAMFPEEIARMMILLTGGRGPILDPFVGSGTTLKAAHKLGLSADGCDLVDWRVPALAHV